MCYNIFCIKCCNRIHDSSVIILFPDQNEPNKQDFICKKCWFKMTDDEKEKEFKNCWIQPKEILI